MANKLLTTKEICKEIDLLADKFADEEGLDERQRADLKEAGRRWLGLPISKLDAAANELIEIEDRAPVTKEAAHAESICERCDKPLSTHSLPLNRCADGERGIF